MKYYKLVRDRIPEIIEEKGERAVIHAASDEEYWEKLKEKLKEEAEEFVKDGGIEEMADILEVIEAICEFRKFEHRQIMETKERKAKERGKFAKRIILEEA